MGGICPAHHDWWVLQATLSWVRESPTKARAALPRVRSRLLCCHAGDSPKCSGRGGRGSLDHRARRRQSNFWDWAQHNTVPLNEATWLRTQKATLWSIIDSGRVRRGDKPSDRSTVGAGARDGQSKVVLGLHCVPRMYGEVLTPVPVTQPLFRNRIFAHDHVKMRSGWTTYTGPYIQ